MRMSLDPTVHSKKALGVLSQQYGDHVQVGPRHGSGILGAALADNTGPAELIRNADGTIGIRKKGLGI